MPKLIIKHTLKSNFSQNLNLEFNLLAFSERFTFYISDDDRLILI